jgi:pimeloyl-ACP methyl ester carboxylesterase
MPIATLHDGSTIEIEVRGNGPTLLLPVNPRPVEGPRAEEIRKYGGDPDLGPSLIEGLRDVFRVVAFDFDGNVTNTPKPNTLTPANAAADLLAVADAAGTDRFVYYGYSWLAVIGLQLAIRTDRLSGLAMGGFPPLNGPYAQMLRVTSLAQRMAAEAQTAQASDEDEWASVAMSEDQARQFATLYQGLQEFDDRAAQALITCPKLCFVGSADEIQYGPQWDGILVRLAGPVVHGQRELEALGWDVHVLDGLDHVQAMQAAQVVPILRSWLLHSSIDPGGGGTLESP